MPPPLVAVAALVTAPAVPVVLLNVPVVLVTAAKAPPLLVMVPPVLVVALSVDPVAAMIKVPPTETVVAPLKAFAAEKVVVLVPATVRPPAPEIIPAIAEVPVFSVSNAPDPKAIEPDPPMLAMLSLPAVRENAPLLVMFSVLAKASPSLDKVLAGSIVTKPVFSAEPAPVKAKFPPDAVMPPVKVLIPVIV